MLRHSTLPVLFQFIQDFLSFLFYFSKLHYAVVSRFQWLIAAEGSRKEFVIIVYTTFFYFDLVEATAQHPPPPSFGWRFFLSVQNYLIFLLKGCKRNQLPV